MLSWYWYWEGTYAWRYLCLEVLTWGGTDAEMYWCRGGTDARRYWCWGGTDTEVVLMLGGSDAEEVLTLGCTDAEEVLMLRRYWCWGGTDEVVLMPRRYRCWGSQHTSPQVLLLLFYYQSPLDLVSLFRSHEFKFLLCYFQARWLQVSHLISDLSFLKQEMRKKLRMSVFTEEAIYDYMFFLKILITGPPLVGA